MGWNLPLEYVKCGTLDNTSGQRIDGYIEIASLGIVELDLQACIVGKYRDRVLSFSNRCYDPDYLHYENGRLHMAEHYMEWFSQRQRGSLTTLLDEPNLVISWRSETNGRCTIEIP